jgi:beta-lactamase superfamily II metal-dependent hydrolase
MLTIFNIGQGDSLLLEAENGCTYTDPPLLIDAGPARAKVANRIGPDELCILITHSHADHLGGLPLVFRKKSIQKVFLPYYLPEITKISQYLQRYSGNILRSPNWSRFKSTNVQLVGDGDNLCNHATVLNPPKQAWQFRLSYSNAERSITSALGILNERGMELPTDEILNYTSPLIDNDLIADEEYAGQARQFVHRFFISLSQLVIGVNIESLPYHVTQEIEMTSNQASVVFKYSHPNDAWLFAGDADETVFNRLISENRDIRARYLKVPHHGSRENLSGKTLDAIQPEYAFVSHNNRKFGRSKDTHPHHEVIDLLDRRGIQTFYTNPVIKQHQQIKSETVGTILNGLVTFN